MPPNPRHPPSAAPPPAGQHPAYGGMPAGFQNMQNFYPNTATQADLQHILRLVSELCDVNANNRKETERLIHGVEKMAAQQKQSGAAATAAVEQPASSAEGPLPKSADHSELVLLQNKHAELSRRFDQQSQVIVRYADILNDYEDTMGSMMVRVREFSHAHTTTLLQWHKYYSDLLQKERDEKHQLFCEAAAKEQTLAEARAKFSEIRGHILDCELPLKQEIAHLKAENRFLKQRLGIPYFDSDDEEQNNHSAPVTAHSTQPINQPMDDPPLIKRDLEATKQWRVHYLKKKMKKFKRYNQELTEDERFATNKQQELDQQRHERAAAAAAAAAVAAEEEDKRQRRDYSQPLPSSGIGLGLSFSGPTELAETPEVFFDTMEGREDAQSLPLFTYWSDYATRSGENEGDARTALSDAVLDAAMDHSTSTADH